MAIDFKGKKIRFDGSRVYLRTLDSADANEDYCRWLNDPMVNKFLATKSATIEELYSYIQAKDEAGDTLFLGIFIKEDDKFIGTIKLDAVDFAGGKVTIAIMIGDKDYWGQGIAGESMKLLIDYSFKELGLKEVNLGVIGQNYGAIKAYQKLGFIETKRELKAIKYGTELYDQVTMVLKKI